MTDLPAVEPLLQRLSEALPALLAQQGRSDPALIGIRTGGVWIASELQRRCLPDAPLGILDIAFYRDDFAHNGLPQKVQPSDLPFSIDGRHLVLVDDVLMSGRTIRAALNELFDYGRPASVTLVCLIDLQARELPIRADVLGASLQLPAGQRLKLSGPQPLQFNLISHPTA